MIDLTIEIDSKSGFCFGVKKAIQIAEDVLAEEKELYCLGKIVHNLEEVKRLEKLGMITIGHENLNNLKGKNVLIRAHGEPPLTYETLRKNNNRIIEATCPVVLKLQDRIKISHEKGDFILIYGKKKHPEILGLVGQIDAEYQVFREYDELILSKIPARLTLYSQTTMDVDQLISIAERLVAAGKEIVLKDTVCRQVLGRKKELQRFSLKKDVILMVAGKDSSNGQVLFQACKDVNPRTYHISSKDDISLEWFKKKDEVGICGATSTPEWLMKEIKEFLLSK